MSVLRLAGEPCYAVCDGERNGERVAARPLRGARLLAAVGSCLAFGVLGVILVRSPGSGEVGARPSAQPRVAGSSAASGAAARAAPAKRASRAHALAGGSLQRGARAAANMRGAAATSTKPVVAERVRVRARSSVSQASAVVSVLPVPAARSRAVAPSQAAVQAPVPACSCEGAIDEFGFER